MGTKKLLIGVLGALVVMAESGAGQGFVNGGFETGDLTGWTKEIRGGKVLVEPGDSDSLSELPFSVLDEVPEVRPSADTNQYFTAVEGDYFLRIRGNPAVPLLVEYDGVQYDLDLTRATIVVWQELELSAGSVVSGLIAMWTTDLPSYIRDHAFVHISGNGVEDTVVSIRLADIEWDTIGVSPPFTPNQSEWRHWEWTAPTTGTYRIELSNTVDDQMESDACFDLNRVCMPPTVVAAAESANKTSPSLSYSHATGILSIRGSGIDRKTTVRLFRSDGACLGSFALKSSTKTKDTHTLFLKGMLGSRAGSPIIVRVQGLFSNNTKNFLIF